MSRFEKIAKSEAATLVNSWLSEEGLSVEVIQDENTDISYVTGFGNVKINMGFHKSSIDSIIIVGAIALEPDEQSMFRYTNV